MSAVWAGLSGCKTPSQIRIRGSRSSTSSKWVTIFAAELFRFLGGLPVGLSTKEWSSCCERQKHPRFGKRNRRKMTRLHETGRNCWFRLHNPSGPMIFRNILALCGKSPPPSAPPPPLLPPPMPSPPAGERGGGRRIEHSPPTFTRPQ